MKAGPINCPVHLAYLISALVLGVFAAVAVPVIIHDETAHFFRSYTLVEGNVFPAANGSWARRDIPASLWKVVEYTTDGLGSKSGYRQLDTVGLRAFWCVPLEPTRRCEFVDVHTVPVFPLGYLVQAIGVCVGAKWTATAPGAFLGGRLMNLLVSALVVALAIRITPVLKVAFACVALLPTTVTLFASCSPDAMVIAVSFLLVGCVLRLAEDGPVPRGLLCLAAGTTIFLALVKFVYLPLAGMLLVVPVARFGGRGRKWIGLALLGAIAAVLAVSVYTISKGYIPPTHTGPGHLCDPAAQKLLLWQQPWRLFSMWIETTCRLGGVFLAELCVPPTHVQTSCPVLLTLLVALLPVVGVLDRGEGRPVRREVKWMAALCFLTVTVLMLTAMYLWWTSPGADLSFGTVPRYFLAILPLALVCLSSGVVDLRLRRGSFVWAVLAFVVPATAIVEYSLAYPLYPRVGAWIVPPSGYCLVFAAGYVGLLAILPRVVPDGSPPPELVPE